MGNSFSSDFPTTQASLQPGFAGGNDDIFAARLMADGRANKEIAGTLGISERTVKTHLGHLFEKLGVTSRTEAIKIAMRRGLVRLE